jgi:plastocyanin
MKFSKYLLLALFVGLIAAGCSSTPPPPLDVTIEMSEYAFSPTDITAQVGQKVTLTLVNVGVLDHELMIGKNVEVHDGQPNGYEVDLFRTADITPMVMGGGMLMTHGDDDHDDGGTDVDSDDGDGEMDMDDDEMDMSLEGDGALMVMMNAGAKNATVAFTVTKDMIGEWEIGCFELDGVHYTSGMVGSFTVTK